MLIQRLTKEGKLTINSDAMSRVTNPS